MPNPAVCYMDSYGDDRWIWVADPGVDPIIALVGENSAGPIVVGGPNSVTIRYMPSYGENIWHNAPDAPFKVKGMCGDGRSGVIVFGSENPRQVQYIPSWTSPWTALPDAPWNVSGVSGHNRAGVTAFGGADNREVAFIDNYGNPHWVTANLAPFSIKGMAGSNEGGVTIFGGDDNKQVAYVDNYANPWRVLVPCPVSIRLIAGDNQNGPVIVGGGFDLQLMSWGDGSGVPPSGSSLVIVGVDNTGQLRVRVFDAVGNHTDTDETQLPNDADFKAAIATLKQQLPGLLPPQHVLTGSEKAQLIASKVIVKVAQDHAVAREPWHLDSHASQVWKKQQNVPAMFTIGWTGDNRHGPIVAGYRTI